MTTIVIVASIINTIATVAIAIYASKAHTLTKKMKESQQQRDEEISDLYQAIVIATILSGPSGPRIDDILSTFKKTYKGTTKIFSQ